MLAQIPAPPTDFFSNSILFVIAGIFIADRGLSVFIQLRALIGSGDSRLATKGDVKEARTEVVGDLELHKREDSKHFGEVKEEIKGVKADIKEVREAVNETRISTAEIAAALREHFNMTPSRVGRKDGAK